MKRCRENGEYVVYDSLWITQQKERKYIQTSLTPIYDVKGNFSKIIAIETDITDLKAAEEALIEKNDNLLAIMEHLEKANEMLDEQRAQIEIQKASLEEEMKKSETLLLAILPDTTAHQLKKKGFVKPKKFKEATVMFIDFVGFSRISAFYNEIEDLLEVLNFYFEKFDEITSQHFIEKIKTIGDCYMCVGGVPHSNKSNPYDTVIAALKIQKMVEELAKKDQAEGKPVWRVRIGIHTGPLVGGIIGKKRFAYDIWGDTVNLASRMETSGETGKVNISDATHSYIKNYISCNYRGKVPAKNLGEINMYFVERIKPDFSEDSEGYIPNAEFRKIIAAV
jgi:class 3 adenylate cyclase